MKVYAIVAALLAISSIATAQTPEQQKIVSELKALEWERGPTQGRVGLEATMKVPEGHFFLDEPNSRKLLQIFGNPPKSGNYAFGPENLEWFAVFHFANAGYVKDDEKIDADGLLQSLKDADGPSNEERKRLGLTQLHTDGWLVPPHYDTTTKRLEWGLRLRDDQGEETINYTSRILGRTGVMAATLVTSPERVNGDVEKFRAHLAGFSYVPGQTYSEYRSGDKVAEYGLGALVLGGAAAAAAKTGLLKSLGKFIWVIAIGALGALSALWKKITGKKE